MPMSKKYFIAAAQMMREINGQTARKARLTQAYVNNQEYVRGFNEAMVMAQEIVMEEVIALRKRCQSPSGVGFKDQTFRDYVEGR